MADILNEDQVARLQVLISNSYIFFPSLTLFRLITALRDKSQNCLLTSFASHG